MGFFSLLFKNILRAKTRTLLTTIGIALGIATMVTFSFITASLESVFGGVLKPGNTDLTVTRKGAADIVLSYITFEQLESVIQTPGVSDVVPQVFTISAVEGNPYFLVTGMEASQLEFVGARLIEGRVHENDGEIMIGEIAAQNKDLDPGETLTINERIYRVVGVYRTGASQRDAGAVMSIYDALLLQGVDNRVSIALVEVAEDADPRDVARGIEGAEPELSAVVDVADFAAVARGKEVTQGIAFAISFLAIVIGGIGVMNTILMSVFERVREIGVLRAVGWSRRRVVGMIVGEAVIIGLIAFVVGVVLALLVLLALRSTEVGEAWLQVVFAPFVFVQALSISLAVAVIGALYPSLRAARMSPTEALRYE